VADLRGGEPTQTLKDVIFSSIVGAGVVSGISGGARQTALAHGFYFFTRSRYTEKAVRYTHGELVAVGLVLQLAYYGRIPDAERFAARLRGWGLAASMGDLGFSFGEEDAEACMEYLCDMDEMKAAGANAVPKLREALRVVFA
jgi:glycerol dehydrogenase